MLFVFGSGMRYIVAAVICFSVLVATGSRAGFLATLVAIVVLAGFVAVFAAKRGTLLWALGGALISALALGLFLLNGADLTANFNALVQPGGANNFADNLRLVLWQAAARMIGDAPVLGLGLGTYENAYPLYAEHVSPYIMDKAHNDYLELAAGWGLPAAILWWSAIGWLFTLCARGVFVRRRNRIYPLLAVGATVLVGFHAVFDFSLQIPAIAFTYAALLGLGVAQSFSSRAA